MSSLLNACDISSKKVTHVRRMYMATRGMQHGAIEVDVRQQDRWSNGNSFNARNVMRTGRRPRGVRWILPSKYRDLHSIACTSGNGYGNGEAYFPVIYGRGARFGAKEECRPQE